MVRRVFNLSTLSPIERLLLVVRLPSVTRLALRLMQDGRVPARNKAVTLGVIAYIFSPFDIPGWIPVLGQLGDALVVVNVLELFIRSAPRHVVDEHIRDLGLEGKFKL
ncbi:MAG TPA: YkvA family protein [Chloroflexota bacterium]|nr:YkvA family protein [Chloroflexota bacterium]